MSLINTLAGLNITKTGFRPCWNNTEGHQQVLRRQRSSPFDYFGKLRFIGDQVIGGKNEDLRLRTVSFSDPSSRHRDSRCRIAPHGFQQKMGLPVISKRSLMKFISAHEEGIAMGDRQDVGAYSDLGSALIGL